MSKRKTKLQKKLEALATEMEDRAGRYGTAGHQPLGVEMGPNGEKHTRRNRHILWGLSGGLNEAASLVRELAENAK